MLLAAEVSERSETALEGIAAHSLQDDWEVWNISRDKNAFRLARKRGRCQPIAASGTSL